MCWFAVDKHVAAAVLAEDMLAGIYAACISAADYLEFNLSVRKNRVEFFMLKEFHTLLLTHIQRSNHRARWR